MQDYQYASTKIDNNTSSFTIDSLKIGFLNVQGLNKKTSILSNFAVENDIKVLCVNEHWNTGVALQYNIVDDFILANSYCRKNHKHGGVAIYTKNCIEFRELDLNFLIIEFDFEATAIFVDKCKLIIVTVYRSPDGDPNIFLDNLEKLLIFLGNWNMYRIVIGGDVNSHFDVNTEKRSVGELLNLLRQFNYSVINYKPTRGSACLDNIFSNVDREHINSDVSPFPFSDHDALWIKLSNLDGGICGSNNSSGRKLIITRPITNGKFSIIQLLICTKWELFIKYDNLNANDTFNLFLTMFLDSFNLCFPRRAVKCELRNKCSKVKSNAWYTSELYTMKERVMVYYNIYKNTKTRQIKDRYTKEKEKYKTAIREAKLNYNKSCIEDSANKCKAAWKIIDDVKNSSNRNTNDIPISADTLNNYFVNTIEEIKNGNVYLNTGICEYTGQLSPYNDVFILNLVTTEDVIKTIHNLKASDSKDIFDITNNLMKQIVNHVAHPLAICFNKCIAEGIFPDALKIAKVIPVYKSGDRKSPCNYRPISLVPIFSKVFETMVKDQVYEYLNQHSILLENQFGYRSGKSTVDAVESLINVVYEAFENKGFAQATFCDLSKAFDCVDHGTLYDKLKFYGFSDISLSFFKSYLEKRRQVVSVNNEMSNVQEVKYGVPQGSVLGPLLFIIMINDLPLNINATSILYADDTTILNVNKSLDIIDMQSKISLKEAAQWFRTNGFVLNHNKTNKLTFGLNHHSVNNNNDSNNVKFLGIYLDSQLSWAQHIKYVCTKLSRVLCLLRGLKDLVPDNYIRNSYFAFFQSVIMYGLLFWGNGSNINDVLLLQKKAIRIMKSAPNREHCKPLFKELNIMTIVNLYIYQVLLYMKENIINMRYREDIHTHNTRYSKKIDVPFSRLSKVKNSYLIMGPKLFNKLPSSIQQLPFRTYKNKLQNWLTANPFYSVEEFVECKETML